MNQGVLGKCIAMTTPFSKEKRADLGGTRTHDTPLTTQSTLPTELPGQLSRQGSKSTTQHNTRQSQTPILCAMAQTAQKNTLATEWFRINLPFNSYGVSARVTVVVLLL